MLFETLKDTERLLTHGSVDPRAARALGYPAFEPFYRVAHDDALEPLALCQKHTGMHHLRCPHAQASRSARLGVNGIGLHLTQPVTCATRKIRLD